MSAASDIAARAGRAAADQNDVRHLLAAGGRPPEPAVERLLRAARRKLRRLQPSAVPAAVASGAVLVDIRPSAQRIRDGEVPWAIVICRNVLEWRCDPSSPARDERVSDPSRQLILLCHEGCQSSLAAAALQDLGHPEATDVVGGLRAWRAAGLPLLAVAPDRAAHAVTDS